MAVKNMIYSVDLSEVLLVAQALCPVTGSEPLPHLHLKWNCYSVDLSEVLLVAQALWPVTGSEPLPHLHLKWNCYIVLTFQKFYLWHRHYGL